jgi:predicted ATP-grasp superfamily ATP-dependent carboligase
MDNTRPILITDTRYRAALAAVRTLGRAGCSVVAAQTRGDTHETPAPFFSRYVQESRWLEGSVKDPGYGDRLLALVKEYDHPTLLCVGADTLGVVSRRREEFARVSDFLIAPPDVLDALNDKETVHKRALELGLPVPREFTGPPERYPVILKPHCGEKLGLVAKERYAIAHDAQEFAHHRQVMGRYDPDPIVQELVTGDGIGADLLLGKEGVLLSALCHRRVREYPVTGGPSTCCVSFYDEALIRQAHRLLASFGFEGMAMVEFKGDKILEVNPRIWGSFPLTTCCGSPYALAYVRAAQGTPKPYTPQDYRTGVKLRYLFSDGAATLGYLRHGRTKEAMGGIRDFFTVPEAMSAKDDKKAYRVYLKNTLRRH